MTGTDETNTLSSLIFEISRKSIIFDEIKNFISNFLTQKTLIEELSEMLENAKENDILVILCLWNGAVASFCSEYF